MPSPFSQFVAIRSSTSRAKYFRPRFADDVVKPEALNVSDRNVKLQVEDSLSQEGMIHLKCIDTGKYLSLDDGDSGYYISARKAKPVSDLSSNNCTLVKYSKHTRGRDGVTVFHVEFRRNSRWHSIKEDRGRLVSGEGKSGSYYTNFVIQDWHQLASASNNKKN